MRRLGCIIVLVLVLFSISCAKKNSFLNEKDIEEDQKEDTYCVYEEDEKANENIEVSLLDKLSEDIYDYDIKSVPTGAFAIIPRDMSCLNFGNEYIYNETKFNLKYLPVVDSDEYVETFTDAQINSDSPLVLILHTHTTEAYNDEGEYYESPLSEFARSHDENKNVIRIGQTIAKILNQNGIPTIHVKSYHDDISYNDAYANSERTIKSYLEKYPTIKYVFDIHRDALMLDDGSTIRPICSTHTQTAAQIMFVVGTNERSGDDWQWGKNLAMAQTLRHRLNDEYENLVRPTYLRRASYNQKYSDYSLLIEVGAAGNSLEEAQASAEIVADAISQLIKGN